MKFWVIFEKFAQKLFKLIVKFLNSAFRRYTNYIIMRSIMGFGAAWGGFEPQQAGKQIPFREYMETYMS